LAQLQAVFDEAFAPKLVDRFATATSMQRRLERLMHDVTPHSSVEADLATLREVLDTNANRRRAEMIAVLSDGLHKVENVFRQVQQSIGNHLEISQTAWNVTAERGANTLFWSYLGSTDRLLSVTYEAVPAGEELLIRMADETVFRSDISQPDYGVAFSDAVRAWVTARLRHAVSNPNVKP
jgi:serine/threonine-protein kinase